MYILSMKKIKTLSELKAALFFILKENSSIFKPGSYLLRSYTMWTRFDIRNNFKCLSRCLTESKHRNWPPGLSLVAKCLWVIFNRLLLVVTNVEGIITNAEWCWQWLWMLCGSEDSGYTYNSNSVSTAPLWRSLLKSKWEPVWNMNNDVPLSSLSEIRITFPQ